MSKVAFEKNPNAITFLEEKENVFELQPEDDTHNHLNLNFKSRGNTMFLSKRTSTSIKKNLKTSFRSHYSMISYSKQNYEVYNLIIIALVLLSSCGTFTMGYNEAIFDTMEKPMITVLNDSKDNLKTLLNIISYAVTLGAILGSLVSGLITNSIGRKNSLLLLDVLTLIGTGLTLIPNVFVIILGRCIVGFGVGGYTYVSRLYLAEMSPIKLRALNIAVAEVFYMIGISIAYAMGFGLKIKQLDGQWWRFMFGMNFLILGLHMIITLLLFNFETPIHFYMKTEDEDETRNILHKIYVNDDDIENVLKEIKKVSKEKKQQGDISYIQLFNKRYLNRTLICIVIIAGAILIGVDTLIYFFEFIFSDYIKNHDTITLYINILGAVQLVSSIIGIILVEHSGRKILLVIGHGIMFVTLVALGFFYINNLSSLYVYIFGIIIVFNALIINPVSNIYLTDVLPEKGIALSYTFYYTFKMILISTFKPTIESQLNYAGLFWIYGGFTLVLFVFSIVKVKETHGKTLLQLDNLY